MFLFITAATKLRKLCFYTCLSVILFIGGGEWCTIPACIAGGIPACLAAGLQGVPAPGGYLIRGLPALRGFACSRGCLLGGGGACSGGGGVETTPESRLLLLRTVRILLECILVTAFKILVVQGD